MQEITSFDLKTPQASSALWKVFSIITVISAAPLLALSIVSILLFGTMLPNELSLIGVMITLVPGALGVAGFVGLVSSINTPPNAQNREKVRATSYLMGCGLTVLVIIMVPFTWLWPVAILPLVMGASYIIGDIREADKLTII
jgi:hypothetical protein